MTLPTFLGIGVPRGGTTWLHTLLESHPDVYMPAKRKEIRFFDLHCARGLEWYERFFCPPEERTNYQAIGEISPQYLYCEKCSERISTTLPSVKMLVMLRHPVDRAYSQYGFIVQRMHYRGSFEEFLASRPKVLEKGFYSRYLREYFRYVPKSYVLALVSDEAFADVGGTCARLADFLDIRVDKFALGSAAGRVNASTVPRAYVAGFAVKTGRRLRRWQLEPAVDLARRVGLLRMMTAGKPLPRIDESVKKDLSQAYARDFDDLERCLEIDLSVWRG